MDKTPQTVDNVIAALRSPGPYQHPALADDMVRERDAPVVIGRRRAD